MSIKIKNINEPINRNNDGKRILITRFHPKNKDKSLMKLGSIQVSMWMKELAPSFELLNDWKLKKIKSVEDFKAKYKEELFSPLREDETKHCLNVLKSIEHYDDNITLLVFPKDKIHGDLIKELINETPIEVIQVDI